MSNFIMSKTEVVVLFDLLGVLSIPINIRDLQEVEEDEYKRIVKIFSDKHLLDLSNEKVRPDKGLEKFLLPMVNAEKVILFNYGISEKSVFCATLYFAKNGLVAVQDTLESDVRFIIIESLEDLALFMPETSQHITKNEHREIYVSYILLDREFSIIHCTRIDHVKNIAQVFESKRNKTSEIKEVEFATEISEYEIMFHEKLKEVYDAVGC